jgi:hypothetical protein
MSRRVKMVTGAGRAPAKHPPSAPTVNTRPPRPPAAPVPADGRGVTTAGVPRCYQVSNGGPPLLLTGWWPGFFGKKKKALWPDLGD